MVRAMSRTQFSMLQIINAALAAQGEDEVTSLEDGTPEFRILARNWPFVVEAEMEAGIYTFSREEAFTQSRVDGKFGFADGYAVPQAALHVRKVWTVKNGQTIEPIWVQDGEHVHVDEAAGIYMEYLTVPDQSFWGANFSRGVQLRLQAILSRATGEPMEARDLDGQAEMAFQTARTVSSKSRSDVIRQRQSSFAMARFRRGPN